MTEYDGEGVLEVEDADIVEVLEVADLLLKELVAASELLTGRGDR